MSMIILGCSYACGEWDQEETISHPGISQYLWQAGYHPINLAVPANCHEWMLKDLPRFLLLNKHLDTKEILLFQTDITRNLQNPAIRQQMIDFHRRTNSSVKQTLDNFYREFYSELEHIITPYNIKAYIVGGVSDVTVDLSTFKNITLLVKSLCRLVDPAQDDDLRVTGVQAWKQLDGMFNNCKEEMIEMMNQSYKRNDFFKKSEYYLDDFHPDRRVHKMIFEQWQQHKGNSV